MRKDGSLHNKTLQPPSGVQGISSIRCFIIDPFAMPSPSGQKPYWSETSFTEIIITNHREKARDRQLFNKESELWKNVYFIDEINKYYCFFLGGTIIVISMGYI